MEFHAPQVHQQVIVSAIATPKFRIDIHRVFSDFLSTLVGRIGMKVLMKPQVATAL